MKPLSEKELREKITDLVYDAKEYGEELYTGHVKTYEEIEKDFEKLLSTVDDLVDLILSDRKAWGEYVIGEDERIDIQSEFDKIDVPHLETDRYPGLDGVRQASRNLLRGWQHQRNQGEKTDE